MIVKQLKKAQRRIVPNSIPIPQRGSKMNKLGWLIFWILLGISGFTLAKIIGG